MLVRFLIPNVNAIVTGVEATGAVGTVLVWGEIIPDQTPNWVEIAA